MPKTPPLLVWEPSRLRTLALRIRNRMVELAMNESVLANRCRELGSSLSRERIAKILMNCQPNPKPSAAKVVLESELQILARALQTSPEWLAGAAQHSDPVLWDALAHTHRAQEILHLLDHYEERSHETLVWAESLMCSFTTPEFLHAYHEAFFHELEEHGSPEEKQKLVQLYDRVGSVRRERRLRGATSDTRFVQLILRSDLEKIARGTAQYRAIAPSVRRDCLKNARDLLEQRWGQIALLIVEDDHVHDLMKGLRGFDSVGACGETFAMLRLHTGDVVWSENKGYVGRYVRLLHAFRERAAYRDRDRVLRLLDRLAASIRGR